MRAGGGKKKASQCRGNVGILELKKQRDPTIFVSNPSLKRGKERRDELLRVGKGIVTFVSRDEGLMSDTLVRFDFCLVCGAERVWIRKF